jgi:DNA-binding MarR family transcriptional regulator
MNIEDSAAYLLSKITVAHRNLLERHLREVGLHSGQVFVLFELWKKDGQRQIDLSENVRLAPPTVNKILTGLLDSGFVTRNRYEDDGRSVRIFLTDEGKQIRRDIEAVWDIVEERTMAALTETEQLVFRQLLTKMIEFQDADDDQGL